MNQQDTIFFISHKEKDERDFNIIKIGLERDREELYERINTGLMKWSERS